MTNEKLYSFILFILYQMKDDESYSTLSKLIYLLDEKHFLMLCKYFGGQTITIPTMRELKVLLTALSMFCEIDINGKDYDKEFKNLRAGVDTPSVREAYRHIKECIENFEFNPGEMFIK